VEVDGEKFFLKSKPTTDCVGNHFCPEDYILLMAILGFVYLKYYGYLLRNFLILKDKIGSSKNKAKT